MSRWLPLFLPNNCGGFGTEGGSSRPLALARAPRLERVLGPSVRGLVELYVSMMAENKAPCEYNSPFLLHRCRNEWLEIREAWTADIAMVTLTLALFAAVVFLGLAVRLWLCAQAAINQQALWRSFSTIF